MVSLIQEKARNLLLNMTFRQEEISKKEAQFNPKSLNVNNLAWELMIDNINAISYPLGAYKIYHFYQLPLPDNWFSLIRSLLVKILSYGELALSPYLDIPFSEIDDNLKGMSNVSLENRLLWMQKAGILMIYAKNFFSMHSKMRFVWVDYMSRLSILMKNSVCYSDIYPALALNHPDHEAYSSIFYLVTSALSTAAESLRRRYELKGQMGDDLEKALVYLNVLKRILEVGGSLDEAVKIKKKHNIWQAKLLSDRQKSQKEMGESS